MHELRQLLRGLLRPGLEGGCVAKQWGLLVRLGDIRPVNQQKYDHPKLLGFTTWEHFICKSSKELCRDIRDEKFDENLDEVFNWLDITIQCGLS